MERHNRVWAALGASGIALMLLGCEPARENIVDTVEPMSTASEDGEMAPGTEEASPTESSAPTATETATQTQ